MTINLSEQGETAKILSQLVEALKQAEGGCSQLIHQHQDLRFLLIRNVLDAVTTDIISIATFNATQTLAVKPI